MGSYIFHGSVLPERVNFTISQSKCSIPSMKIEINLTCFHSKIVAECSCDDLSVNIFTLRNHIETTVRTLVDVVGFTTVIGYDVEIESAYNLETNELYIFGVHENIFENATLNDSTAQGIAHPDITTPILELIKMAGINPELGIALSDFREAIRQPSFTSFHCYRAIEALRCAFDGEKSVQWEELRKALGIDRDGIDEIGNSADALRHGQITSQSWDVRKKHMLITWEIIKKYIDWRSSNTAGKIY